ncbi:hypothetical protein GM921_16900 [Pedobacter sp. LMG 31464]|uniref:Uncharacterized protein n=1 Tax=Pedobacter planticolens TaxID=2679964 RepID=A0A923IWI3_9SPHI|nr:hypothetical protein [Pedobacter planticolens]MBB2147181.1 hypothetical protein [Pedobacter planticolens]
MNNTTALNKLTDIWNKYNQVRLAGDKKTANKLLADYIGLLKQEDQKDIKIFVDNICSLTLDTDDKIISNNGTEVSEKDTRIQHPLFKEIILPILKDQYKKDSAKHIKWIGQLEQFFYSDYTTTITFLRELNITEYFEARYFFEKSFAINNSQNTLTLLLNRMAKTINFYTHEVPMGVLVNPDVLAEELIIFRQYWQQSNTKNIWEATLTEWELISKHWTLYVATKNKYDSFETYLNTSGIQLN